jgi:hypothetical protein
MPFGCRLIDQSPRISTPLAIPFLLCLSVSCGLLSGCFSKPSSGNRVAVAGNVTRGGKPIGPASIMFSPEKGSNALGAGGGIKNGRYEIPADSGPTPGIKYKVIIETIVGIPSEKIPRDQYKGSEKFELTAEIPAKGSKELNFEVE